MVYGFVIHKQLVLETLKEKGLMVGKLKSSGMNFNIKKIFGLIHEVCQQLVYGFALHKQLVLVHWEEKGLKYGKFENIRMNF